jgi:hypothetical protein
MFKKLLVMAFIALLPSGNSYAALIGQYDLDGNGFDNISSSVAPSTDITGAADRFGNLTGAVSLNGSTSIINPLDVGIDDASQDYSLSIWFKQNTSALGGLISNNTPSGPTNGWSTVARIGSDNRLLFLAGAAQNSGAEKSVISVNTSTVGAWNHAAFVYDKNGPTSTLSIYLNGDLEASASSNFSTMGNQREDWLLGAQYTAGLTPAYYLDGLLDDFRIYDTALTAAEVSAMVSTVPVPAAIWLFGTGILGLIGFSKRRAAMLKTA